MEVLSGVDSKTIARIERGDNNAYLNNLSKLALALDKTVDYFVFGIEETNFNNLIDVLPEGKRARLMTTFESIIELIL